jgi:hypothetical protein
MLDERYNNYQDYIQETVDALNSASETNNSLQRSTYNPDVLALTYCLQILIDLVADNAAMSLTNYVAVQEEHHKVNEIINYLQEY